MCALFAADVLIFERGKQKGPKARSRRIDLDDWKRITPTLGKTLQEKVQARRVALQEGSIDAGTAVAQTLRERNQLAGSLHAPTVKARKHQQRRGGKIVYCERKGNIRVDVRARGRAKRSAPRKAAACAPGGTEGQ